MKYYSTNKKTPNVTLEMAVIKGLAEDKGLFMPERIEKLPDEFFETIGTLSFQEIAFAVAQAFFGEDVETAALKKIVYETLPFDTPLVEVEPNIFSLELFHGPTLAFKDVGARFMSRMLAYYISRQSNADAVNVLVATSGDTGSAVANGFLGVEGIRVFVLFPKGKVSKIQESQFTTLGQNITALEVDGTFDDCQRLVKSAFLDEELNRKMKLTSANSINVARFLPQAFYYFYAFSQLRSMHPKQTAEELGTVFCVPSGNFGNLTAGLVAKRMGLPVKRFIAANNRNDIFLQYLKTGIYFVRILDLYGHSHEAISKEISGVSYTDEQITETMRNCFVETGYLLDPHGACGYQALKDELGENENGIFLETAHPAKFSETVMSIQGLNVEIPARLLEFMKNKKHSIPIGTDFEEFKTFLLK